CTNSLSQRDQEIEAERERATAAEHAREQGREAAAALAHRDRDRQSASPSPTRHSTKPARPSRLSRRSTGEDTTEIPQYDSLDALGREVRGEVPMEGLDAYPVSPSTPSARRKVDRGMVGEREREAQGLQGTQGESGAADIFAMIRDPIYSEKVSTLLQPPTPLVCIPPTPISMEHSMSRQTVIRERERERERESAIRGSTTRERPRRVTSRSQPPGAAKPLYLSASQRGMSMSRAGDRERERERERSVRSRSRLSVSGLGYTQRDREIEREAEPVKMSVKGPRSAGINDRLQNMHVLSGTMYHPKPLPPG
ncbi:hypothetical protein KIPB_013216, partial [Kipferlia bialata]